MSIKTQPGYYIECTTCDQYLIYNSVQHALVLSSTVTSNAVIMLLHQGGYYMGCI